MSWDLPVIGSDSPAGPFRSRDMSEQCRCRRVRLGAAWLLERTQLGAPLERPRRRSPDLLLGRLGGGPRIGSSQLLLELVAQIQEVLHGGRIDRVLDEVGRVVGCLA